jgi:hypothetical protein
MLAFMFKAFINGMKKKKGGGMRVEMEREERVKVDTHRFEDLRDKVRF